MTHVAAYTEVDVLDESGDRTALDIPFFDLPPLSCAGYARVAAAVMFDKWYSQSNAWNRRYHDKMVWSLLKDHFDGPVESELGDVPLEVLINEGLVKPGMILGVVNPGSEIKGLDERGKPLCYTHNSLYLGQGWLNFKGKPKPLIYEQFHDKLRIITLADYAIGMLIPIEVMDASGEKPKDFDELKHLQTLYRRCKIG